MATPLDVDLENWDPWSPWEVARQLDGLTTPWYVAAGWALDLFLGRQTREHDDIEVGVPAHSFSYVRVALSGFEVVVVGDGKAWPATPESLAAHRQTWVRSAPGGPWLLDVFREPWVGDTWVYERDPRIQLPVERVISRTPDGVPYLQPEIVLLLKARAVRPKDEIDLATVLPHLDSGRRAWLYESLALVQPGHSWLETLQPTKL